jgi:hypothetical protein
MGRILGMEFLARKPPPLGQPLGWRRRKLGRRNQSSDEFTHQPCPVCIRFPVYGLRKEFFRQQHIELRNQLREQQHDTRNRIDGKQQFIEHVPQRVLRSKLRPGADQFAFFFVRRIVQRCNDLPQGIFGYQQFVVSQLIIGCFSTLGQFIPFFLFRKRQLPSGKYGYLFIQRFKYIQKFEYELPLQLFFQFALVQHSVVQQRQLKLK